MNGIRRAGLLLAAGALGFAGITACQPETSGPDTGVTVREIQNGRQDSPHGKYQGKYAGKKVTVSADVSQIFGPHAFSIAGTQSGIEPLLVVHTSKIKVNEGNPIKVTGVVHTKFDKANVEGTVDYEFDNDVFTDFNGAPYIKATTIQRNP